MRLATAQDLPKAKEHLGQSLHGYGDAPHDSALALFWQAANAGKTMAQLKMVKRYETGDGVRQDPKKSMDGYLRRPAGQGYRPAMCALGETHPGGIGQGPA
ncbi:MAG: hypothetical protein LBP92_13900 [Deltaproteobacteria bacterium]|jgi:TPR repeat protein|nr:hypothetical protein [Deltaproteobacteria bacterium]